MKSREIARLEDERARIFEMHRRGLYTDADFLEQKKLVDRGLNEKRLRAEAPGKFASLKLYGHPCKRLYLSASAFHSGQRLRGSIPFCPRQGPKSSAPIAARTERKR